MRASPAGWYPQQDGRLRYWDGTSWTDQFAAGGGAPGALWSPPEPASSMPTAPGAIATSGKPWFTKKRFVIPGAVLALVMVSSALNGPDDTTPASAGSSPTAPARAAGPTADSAVPAPAATATPSAKATTAAPRPAAKPAAPKPVAPVSQLGKVVRDGKFSFTVTAVKCGITKVGTNEYLQKKAQGQFCAVTMSVTNIGDEPQMMFADNQYAFDAQGRKLSADSEASIYDDSSQVLWEKINPGNSVRGKVYFDIPKAAKITRFELHDSAFSGGVTVRR